MNAHETRDRHTPRTEFVASLEREIVRALHRAPPLEPSLRRPSRRRDHLRAIVGIALGLVLGVGTQLASAQVQGARHRSELESAAAVDRTLAALRYEVARVNHEQARARFATGALSRQSLLQAEMEQRRAEFAILRIDLDLAEIGVTAAAPRDELWAPLVGTRDFVRERLMLTAALEQQRLTTAESAVAEAERLAKVMATTFAELSAAQVEAAHSKRDFQVVAQRLMLRKQALDEELSPGEVARRAQRIELISDFERAQTLVQLVQRRLTLARERHAVGAATQLDVKRAEVELLERNLELQRVQLELQQARVRTP